MEKEENVYGETTLTGEVAEAKEKEALTVLGKFKDVSALERAYESLQAEFTRRSQKLRELEKEMENFKKTTATGAEKLRKTAKARREETKLFDAFVADMGAPSREKEKPIDLEREEEASIEEGREEAPSVPVPEKEEANEGNAENSAASRAAEKGALEKESEGAFLSAEELFKRANDDESVRLRIVGEYLASLGKSGAPLTTGGVSMLASPPARAKTVGEAGNMALTYFRKAIEK